MDPQHGVSPGPGKPPARVPENEEWADSIFLRLLLPQAQQTGFSLEPVTSNSLISAQSRHR
jgi:hypothetical protein